MSTERSSARESATAIDETAAEWVARADRGTLSTADEAALEAWLAADRRRAGAFARACAVSAHFDRAQALGKDYDAAKFATPASSRFSRGWRRSWVGVAAAAFVIGAVALWIQRNSCAFTTGRGEMRMVPLSDGSAVTLNTASRIQVRYTEARRRIELIEGEALFTVAKLPQRPFIVESGDTQVRALGTSFTVSRVAGRPVRVVVRDGTVEVTHKAGVSPAPVRMGANTRLDVMKDAHTPFAPAQIAPSEVARQLAWREGMISLDGVSLRTAAAEFARYSDTRIVIDDPEIAERTVTGLFSASNAAGFARAVASSMGLQVDTVDEAVHLHQ